MLASQIVTFKHLPASNIRIGPLKIIANKDINVKICYRAAIINGLWVRPCRLMYEMCGLLDDSGQLL